MICVVKKVNFIHHCTFKTPTFRWAFFIRALVTVLRSDFATDKLPFIYKGDFTPLN